MNVLINCVTLELSNYTNMKSSVYKTSVIHELIYKITHMEISWDPALNIFKTYKSSYLSRT